VASNASGELLCLLTLLQGIRSTLVGAFMVTISFRPREGVYIHYPYQRPNLRHFSHRPLLCHSVAVSFLALGPFDLQVLLSVFASVGRCPRERLDLRLLGVLAITPEIASHTHILASQAPMPQYLIHRSARKVNSRQHIFRILHISLCKRLGSPPRSFLNIGLSIMCGATA
jgi:hypothetical protein